MLAYTQCCAYLQAHPYTLCVCVCVCARLVSRLSNTQSQLHTRERKADNIKPHLRVSCTKTTHYSYMYTVTTCYQEIYIALTLYKGLHNVMLILLLILYTILLCFLYYEYICILAPMDTLLCVHCHC